MLTRTNYFLAFFVCFIFSSCGNSSALDRVFKPNTYKKEYQILFRAADVSLGDLFLINYSILRHQAYFGYDIKGKTYRELLAMAKQFQVEGMPVEEVYQYNGKQNKIKQSLKNNGAGAIRRSGDSRKILRALLFDCVYENTSKENVVLLSSSFLINGPFKKRITTAGYEINCILKAGEKTTISFALEGKTIIDNLKFNGNRYAEHVMVDSLFKNIEIQIAGNSIQQKTRFFEVCNYKTRVEPFKVYKIAADETFEKRRSLQANGLTKIEWGNAHYLVKEQKEPIHMQ